MEEGQRCILQILKEKPQMNLKEFEHVIEMVEEKFWKLGYWHCLDGKITLSRGRPAFRFWCHAVFHQPRY